MTRASILAQRTELARVVRDLLHCIDGSHRNQSAREILPLRSGSTMNLLTATRAIK